MIHDPLTMRMDSSALDSMLRQVPMGLKATDPCVFTKLKKQKVKSNTSPGDDVVNGRA